MLTWIVSILVPLSTWSNQVAACPANMFILELQDGLAGKRANARAFALRQGGRFEAVSLQIDPLDESGRLRFFDKSDFRQEPLEPLDRLVLKPDQFGQRITKKDRLPCFSPTWYELESQDYPGKFAYLGACQSPVAITGPAQAVSFSAEEARLASPQYEYRFNKKNYMLFDEVSIVQPEIGSEVVARESELLIHSDIKNFFTISFDQTDIESRMERHRLGRVSNLAQLSFYLKVLFFKIKMELTTDVAFYEDSGHIPMLIQIPVDARTSLNRGSGVLYSWKLAGRAANAAQELDLPMFSSALIEKGGSEFIDQGMKYCNGEDCLYRFSVRLDQSTLAMIFRVRRELVANGFYPTFVPSIKDGAKAMGWDIDDDKVADRIGLYFEVSGLPKGGHPWDFWLSLGSKIESRCPSPLTIRRMAL